MLMKIKTLDHFGFIAPFYDKAIPLRRAEKLIELARLPVDGRLLDAGGGTGRVAQSLKRYVSRVVVADISIGMLSEAKAKDGLSLICSFSESLPIPDETFERIIMIDALHHVLDQQETAAELYRVLKPGGRIVIEEPDIGKFMVKLIAIAEKILLMRSHFLSPPKIVELFRPFKTNTQIVREEFSAWVIIDKT